jgi:hypothetical protein
MLRLYKALNLLIGMYGHIKWSVFRNTNCKWLKQSAIESTELKCVI